MSEIRSLLILGCGYVGERLARACIADGIHVLATVRRKERAHALRRDGVEALLVRSPLDIPDEALRSVDALVDSIPLERCAENIRAGQPRWLAELAPKLGHLRWAAYLSSTGVYGDANGAWVDETWRCRPTSIRGRERLRAEGAWLDSGLPAEVFRLSGIYGPGRHILGRLKAGGYKVVKWEPPHYANRIHVDDVVAALKAAMHKPSPGRIVNLSDDAPLPHHAYAQELARLIDAPAPILLTPEQAEEELSPAMLDFFRDNKRVSNRLLRETLLPSLKYPNFRTAVADLLAEDNL